MHPEADALLDAIFDAPDDDTPRLVYADWLQEHGQEAYAQFIRLQCAAAREPFWSEEANRLWEQIGRVWARLDEEWWPATRDDWDLYHGANLDAIHFERGFPSERLTLTADQLVRYSNSCWPWLPFPVMTLRSGSDGRYYDPDEDDEVFSAPYTSDDGDAPDLPRLSRVRRLNVVALGWRQKLDCWRLVCSPQLSNLEALDLSGVLLPINVAEQMLARDRFPVLREVRIRVFDPARHAPAAGCLTADVDPSAARLTQLQRRFETRFKKVTWRTSP